MVADKSRAQIQASRKVHEFITTTLKYQLIINLLFLILASVRNATGESVTKNSESTVNAGCLRL